ncbi:MAG: CPBP family intramembrane glutamic endopeptidase [Gemmatimonadaceae bacterium]
MRKFIPDAAEPWIVLLAVVGVFVGSWVLSLQNGGSDAAIALDNREALLTLGMEGVFALLFIPWLWWRGWRGDALTAPSGPLDVPRGIVLWFGSYLALGLVFGAVALVKKDIADPPVKVNLSDAVIVSVSILNAVFEEFLWLAYGVTALAKRIGLRRACIASVALRTGIHVYEGPLAVLGVLPIGIVFTWYFARTKRVWPVIVAHALQDAFAFVYLRGLGEHR